MEHLELKKKEESNIEKKAILIAADIDKLQLKQKQVEKTIIIMEAQFIECMKLAGKESHLSFVIKGNAFKRKSDQAKWDIQVLEEELVELKKQGKKKLRF